MRIAERTGLKLKYDTIPDGGDARAILSSTLAVVELIENIGAEIAPDERFRIRARQPEIGSIIIGLELVPHTIQQVVTSLFSQSSLAKISELVGIVGGVIALRKALKKEEPKSVHNGDNNIVIINVGDNRQVESEAPTFRAYNTDTVRKSLDDIFDPIADSPSIERFTMLELDNRPILSVERTEFTEMVVGPPAVREQVEYTTQRVITQILRPSFEKGLGWDLMLFGSRRAVPINDPAFLNGVRNREKFAMGDALDVDLQIKSILDVNIGAFVPKEYQITKVHRHVVSLDLPLIDSDGNTL